MFCLMAFLIVFAVKVKGIILSLTPADTDMLIDDDNLVIVGYSYTDCTQVHNHLVFS